MTTSSSPLGQWAYVIGLAAVISVFASLQIAVVSQGAAAQGTENEKDGQSSHFLEMLHTCTKGERGGARAL